MTRPALLRDSLRLRLLAGTLVWILASIAVAGWGLDGLFRRHVEQQFDAELKTHLDQLTANLVFDERGQPSLSAPLSDPRLSRPLSGLYWQIDRLNRGDAPVLRGLLRSRSLWDTVLEVPHDALGDGAIHRHRIGGPQAARLGVVERMLYPSGRPDLPLRLIVAADEALMDAPAQRFGGMLWLALGILGAGLAVTAVVQVAVGLAPLSHLHKALSAVRNGEAQQLTGDFPAEIGPLVDEFNTVIAQNAEVVARARTQSGNLAHALKTPLSVMSNAAALEQGEFARLVGEQVETARRQVEYHLKRARVAAAVNVPGARTGVALALDQLAKVMRRVHAERDLDLQVFPVAGSLCFRGEEQDLHEMLGNLLDNACKWAKHRIEVRAVEEQEQVVITVADDGNGLPAARRDAMLQRGVRADEQVAGSGLGLAIVDDLARMYGGEVMLADSPLGGLQVELRLPACPTGAS
ncbi:sensor histidine kinase [Janthinobacterium sp. 17J80-10]|uniref:sensor histidine kinase n=1 Tax=Janthinobacterium sp. 17J80-10 TaxID=2497863 RepID=UPI0010057DEF|nr:sensor histidine kinase [Janthinobacterium sp. 17J80-10]QAU35071.1 GHKL domain-containing protein [Janthinobacterium sp. 17J80-10]